MLLGLLQQSSLPAGPLSLLALRLEPGLAFRLLLHDLGKRALNDLQRNLAQGTQGCSSTREGFETLQPGKTADKPSHNQTGDKFEDKFHGTKFICLFSS